jgi:hypothetical protein
MVQRTYRRLTATQVAKLAAQRIPGMHPDGDGLYLAISNAGVPSWAYRFMIAGRTRERGSGHCAETTDFPSEVREMALAHKIRNEVEAAYRRGDLFDKRRQLMAAWASYISGAEVVSFPTVRQSA